ncbi:hypothetical protein J4Q44_G00099050, partial [Coregonus suidteri]
VGFEETESLPSVDTSVRGTGKSTHDFAFEIHIRLIKLCEFGECNRVSGSVNIYEPLKRL